MNWFRCFKFIAGWFPPSFFSTRKRLINSPSKLIRSYNKRKLKQGVKKNTSFLIFSYFSLSTPKKYFLLFLFFFKTISASFTSLSQPVSVLRKGGGCGGGGGGGGGGREVVRCSTDINTDLMLQNHHCSTLG